MIRSKKQYHRCSGICTLFQCILFSITYSVLHPATYYMLLYKDHTRQSPASSPLWLHRSYDTFPPPAFFSLFFSSSFLLFFHNFTTSTLQLNSSIRFISLSIALLLSHPIPRTTPPSDLFHRRSPISVTNTFRRPSFCRFSSFCTTSGTEASKFLPFIFFLHTPSRSLLSASVIPVPPFSPLSLLFLPPSSPSIYCWHFGT